MPFADLVRVVADRVGALLRASSSSSAASGTNWRAIGSAASPGSISAAIAGVIATA